MHDGEKFCSKIIDDKLYQKIIKLTYQVQVIYLPQSLIERLKIDPY